MTAIKRNLHPPNDRRKAVFFRPAAAPGSRRFPLGLFMTVKEKLYACALAGVFILLVLFAYGYLVVSGKAEAAPFLALLTSLVMAVVGLVSGLAGHAAGAGSADTPPPLVLKATVPAGLPASPTAPTAEAAAAGTALAPSPVPQ